MAVRKVSKKQGGKTVHGFKSSESGRSYFGRGAKGKAIRSDKAAGKPKR